MITFLVAGESAHQALADKPGFDNFANWARYGAGLLANERQTFCVLPRVLADSVRIEQRISDVGLLMRALRSYSQLRTETRNVLEQAAEGTGNSCNELEWAAQIEAAVGLLDDFFRHGVWRRDSTRFAVTPPGHIHWTRTVQRNAAIQSSAGPVHDPLVHVRRTQNTDDPLWRVWASCLRRSAELLAVRDSGTIPRLSNLVPDGAARALCRDNAERVFDDRSRSILQWLASFLNSSSNATAREATYIRWLRIEHEEHLWEAAVRNAITGSDETDSTALPPMPDGRWYSDGSWRRASGPRLDCRCEVEVGGSPWLIVADAKRYEQDADVTGGDLYKQWLYAYFSSDAHHSAGFRRERIVNVFVMPSASPGIARATGLFRFAAGTSDRWQDLGTVMRFELDYRRALELFQTKRVWPGLASSIVGEWNRLLREPR